MIWCADRFPNAPHSVSMIRSFGWDVNLFFSILSCFLFLFLSVLFYFTNFFRHQSFSFLSLKILIRRRMLRLRLPDISAACRLPVISDTFLLLWIARNITAFYTRACLKNLVILFLSEIQQKNGVFLMKVLILSCNTGGGHNAAASALKESLNFYHHEAEVLDLMSLGRKHTSALVGGAYVKLVSVFPAGFGALYQLGELVRKFPWKSPVYYANARLGNALADYIDQNHFNAVVTTHLYPAETLTWMKQKGRLTIPCVAIATDYACIPFWEETNCDYYVVPHKDLIPEFASCGIPEEKLLPLGIPVRPAFARPASKEDVRRHLGLPENAPLFLVMSGSMGFGKVHLLAHELVSRLENGEQAVIICGNNKKRMRSLRLQFHKNPNVHIIGFTRHVAEYMAAADVLFTKPGGLSSTEAAVRRVPLVHTDPIPGCETKNRAFFVSRGMSVTGAHQKELAEAGISLARDDARQIAMRDAQHQNSHPQAGTSITHLLEKLVSE